MKFEELTPQIAVHCKNLEEVNEFREMCRKHNFEYPPAISYGWNICGSDVCYNVEYMNKNVTYTSLGLSEVQRYKVIEFADLEDVKMSKKIKFEDIDWTKEVVHCKTWEEVQAFEKMCKEHNWNIRNKAIFSEGYGKYNNNICFRHDENKLPVYSPVSFYKDLGYNVIEFSDVIDDTKQYPTIVITTDGVTTTATMRHGHEVLHKATAICSENDEFDYKTGADLALDRVFAEEELDSTRMNGKYVRLTPGQDVTVGKIYEFVNGNCAKTDNPEIGIFCSSFNDKNWLKIIE